MKNKISLILIAFIITLNYTTTISAQDSPQWHLPEGAKARIGKGSILDIAYSPDGTRLAVSSDIGMWFYDAQTGKELSLFAGDTYAVSSIAYSPDGKTIAGGGWNIRLWDAETGTYKTTLIGHNSRVSRILYGPEGKTIVTSSSDGTVLLWDLETGTYKTLHKTTHPRNYPDHGPCIAYSPDGKTIAFRSTDNGNVILWDTKTGTQKTTLTGHNGWVSDIAYSPDGKTIAGGGYRGYLWDAETGVYKATLQEPQISRNFDSVTYSPDGKTIASTRDGTVTLWDAETGTHKATLRHTRSSNVFTSTYNRVVYSPDGKTIASVNSDESAVTLWDAETGTHKIILTGHNGHNGWVSDIAYSPDGKTIAGVSTDDDSDLMLWDVKTGAYKVTLVGSDNASIDSIAYSPDGKTIAIADSYTLRLWDAETGTVIHEITLPIRTSLNNFVYSPDGKTIIGASTDGTVHLWDVHTGTHKKTLTGHAQGVLSGVIYSPDGKTFATVGEKSILLWESEAVTHKSTFIGHAGDVYSVVYSPDGKTIASGSSDNTIRIWNTMTGQHLRTLSGHTDYVYSVAFSPDGKTIASGSSDNTIRLWNANTGTLLRTLTGHSGGVSSIAFNPDGKTIASGSSDNTIRLWNTNTGILLRTLIGHSGDIFSVTFSPDGNTLASGSWDGTVLLWELNSTPPSDTVVNLSASVASPEIGEQLIFSLNIADGQNIAGYQATITYDATALSYVQSENGTYLPTGAFFIPPKVDGNTVQLAASSLAGETMGDGTLATITFEVVAVKESTVRLSDVILTNSTGKTTKPQTEDGEITMPLIADATIRILAPQTQAVTIGDKLTFPLTISDGENITGYETTVTFDLEALRYIESVNGDYLPDGANFETRIVEENMLTLSANSPAGESNGDGTLAKLIFEVVAIKSVTFALSGVRLINAADASLLPQVENTTIEILEDAQAVDPNGKHYTKWGKIKTTAVFQNYPNPFNPETWIPYQLAAPVDVTLTVYAPDGTVIRTLELGHQPIGMYQTRNRAAYWDGKNAQGELVASGVYFYTFSAGKFTATRRMLIRK